MIVALSSTAIALQTLSEKGLLKTAAGQSSFAVLLFQDIAVIPMLALFPLLATHGATGGRTRRARRRPGSAGCRRWAQTLAVLGTVAGIVVVGHFSGAPPVPRRGKNAAARAVHGRRAAAGDRHRALDDQGRLVARARHVRGRRRAGRKRVSPRARERHRSVQGPVARAVFHRGRRIDRFSDRGRGAGPHFRPGRGDHRGEGRRGSGAGPGLQA